MICPDLFRKEMFSNPSTLVGGNEMGVFSPKIFGQELNEKSSFVQKPTFHQTPT